MRVHWTDTAIEHLEAIHSYIAKNLARLRAPDGDRLTRRSQQITKFPQSGRQVPEYELRQIREVLEGPYRIIYYVKPDQIDVLAVVHAAQQTL